MLSARFAAKALVVVATLALTAGSVLADDLAASAGPALCAHAQPAQGKSPSLKWVPYHSTGGTPAATTGVKSPLRVAQNAPQGEPEWDPMENPFSDRFGNQMQPGGTPGESDAYAPSLMPHDEGTPELSPIPHSPLGSPEDSLTCPNPGDKDFFKPINELTTKIGASEGTFPKECSLGDRNFIPRCWAPTTFTWKASGLCHKPLYFEDVALERYGHSWGPFLQPFISGGHFFLTVPLLPYEMGLEPPCECIYSLGYYRPGSCAPYMLDPIPLSVRAGLLEAGVFVGGAALIP